MLIRRETPDDIAATRAVTAAAFTRPGQPEHTPAEAGLVDELRADPGWLPALSLVALGPGDAIIGHVLATRGHIDSAPALGIGPVSVHPDHQLRGVGSALMHAVLAAADALGEHVAVLLGDPAYYRRFGFRLSSEYDILPPIAEWQPHFQVRTLTAYVRTLRGTFHYAKPFDSV